MANYAQMILPYRWILETVEEEPMTIASKMILFRGERVFRVGLKNHAQSPILLFLAADINRLGMSVEDVTYGIEDADTCPAKMALMKREREIGVDGSLQLFTINLDKMVTGKRTFVFRICIKGSVPGYSYRLSDRLGKDQLWAAKENPNLADVEFIVKGQKLLANKSILAARSPVFAGEFSKEQPVRKGRHQIRIDSVEPSTVENFLHFIYTGEPMSSLANEQLLMLAEKYRLTTLTSLCQVALKKIETKRMVDFIKRLNTEAEISSSQVRPEKDTEIFFDRTTPTFRCAVQFAGNERGQLKCMMKYQKEEMFFAYITGHFGEVRISKPVIHFTCAKHRRFGLKVEDIYLYFYRSFTSYSHWFKMESKKLQTNAELLQRFTANLEEDIITHRGYYRDIITYTFNFDIKTVCTIGNYYYEMMDENWLKDLWAAATDQKLTDVDIFVGTVKLMEAHRIILSARSPVLNILLNKVSNATKSIVYFREEFDVDTVKHFLRFLYTGSLEEFDVNMVTLCLQFLYTGSLDTFASKDTDYKQLLELATMYEVETLKNCCQLINVPPDVEDLTSSLLEL